MRSLYLRKDTEGSDSEIAILKENADFRLSDTADENCVLVRVKACALSTTDVQIIEQLNLPSSEMPIGRAISGVVEDVGNCVNSFKSGDEVVALLPLDSQYSGCADLCVVNEYDLLTKPKRLEFNEAVACMYEGVRAYTALQIQARMCAGETILVMDGATKNGSCLIQLAQNWGAKVITTVNSQEEKLHLESFKPPITSIIDVSNGKTNTIRSVCLEETGGLGVDIIIDSGVNMFPDQLEDDVIAKKQNLPSKHELISSLAICGRWVTSHRDLQIDPPNSELLFLKNASISYLFPSVWTLSTSQQGRYLHILRDVMNKVASGVVKPLITGNITLDDVPSVYPTLRSRRIGAVIVEMK
ncbi:quinone oxidoreductase-like protein 1 [Anneissia japonica]|uniref:quinone oxidoreductase-like protein 1 n=1 Tax=Anneissia japonica TaxID=1529436 RepID=UPI0014256F8F|nr:quinone oxidoreductase-like protein 1 [Anneissia japonica]